jgi:flavodoxin
MSKILVAYYSRAGENYFSGKLMKISVGNTARLAEQIIRETGADSYHIEQEVPYSEDYNTCIMEAQKDQRASARPALKNLPQSLDGYTEIYLGYPNYWGTMPMAVFTFLEAFDFSGKVIHPFCTHEGSGFGHSLQDLQKACPGARITQGLEIQGSRVSKSGEKVHAYIQEVMA